MPGKPVIAEARAWRMLSLTSLYVAQRTQARAEDLIGAGYVALARAAGRWQPARGAALETYALPLVRSAMREEAQRLMGHPTVDLSELAESLIDETGCPFDLYERRAVHSRLTRALCRLSDRHLDVILLRYQQGYTFQDVAEQLGISQTRAHQMHGDAIRRLRQWLGAYEELFL